MPVKLNAQQTQKSPSAKQSLLLIAPHGSYRTMRYLQAAARLDLNVVIVSEGKYSIVSEYAQGVHVQFSRPEEALAIILKETVSNNITVVIGTDDSVIELAAKVAQHLDLAHNDVNAARLARRKDLARDVLKQNNVPIPEYRLFKLDDLLDVSSEKESDVSQKEFPLVIKPLSLSASRGVIRVNNQKELLSAAQRVKKLLDRQTDLEAFEIERVLLEEYIHGEEIAVEGVVENGKFKLLTIFDKPDPLHGPYFEETYYITPTRLDSVMVDEVSKIVQSACEVYGINTGPVHAECRIRESQVYLIEMAARTIGGLCSDILEYGLGCTLEEIVLKQAIGTATEATFSETAAGVLMIPVTQQGILRRIEGLLEASKVEFIEDINIQLRDGYELVPLPEGNSYLGFVFAKAPSFEQVEHALRTAYACLNIVVAPMWKLTNQNV